jgi:hypothetical protein
MVKPALLLYDTMLSLPSEVKFIWRGKFVLAAVLYFMARYGAIISAIIYIWLDTSSNVTLQVHVILNWLTPSSGNLC